MITRELEKTAVIETAHGTDVRNTYDKSEAFINVITLKPLSEAIYISK